MPETTIIPSKADNRWAEFGSAAGKGVASSLEQKILNMAKSKADKITQGHLQTLMPQATQQELAALTHLGPDLYTEALKKGAYTSKNANPQQEPNKQNSFEGRSPGLVERSGLQSLQGLSQDQGQTQMNMAQGQQVFKPSDAFRPLASLGLRMTPEQEQQFNALSPENQKKIIGDVYDKVPPQHRKKIEEAIDKAQIPMRQEQTALQGNQQPQQVIGSQQPGVGPQQPQRVELSDAFRSGNDRLQFEKERERRIADQYAHKSSSKFVHDVLGMEKAKNEEDNILKRIIKVTEKEGSNVRNPVLSEIMKTIGIDFSGLKNGDTQELDKLGRWFLRGGAKIFGGRVSNAEMYAILDQVPNALQSKEGRLRLAKQMLLANKDFHDEAKVTKQLIRENKGKYPLDLELQVSERMEPNAERNSYNFINGIYDDLVFEGKSPASFKVGQKLDFSKFGQLPNGTEYSKGGKKYRKENGKEVAL